MVVPNFIIAGASKTGSVWLNQCLSEHPQVFVTPGSPDYFSLRYHRGDDWYRARFDEHQNQSAIGEKSTSYFCSEAAPARIQAWNPGMRLLFVLRDPVRRAYSHYCMQLRSGLASDRIEEELRPGQELVDEGLYFRNISRFLEYFPQSQVHVLIYDDLQRDPAGFLRQIFSCLDVDPEFHPSLTERPFHVTKSRPRFQRLFNTAVTASNWLGSRSRLCGGLLLEARKRGLVDWLHRLNRGPDFPLLTPGHARRLAEHFQDDARRLSDWLGRDVTTWLSPYLAPPADRSRAA
jgi:hypothetical protein